MKDLKCGLLKCKYNKGYACSAKKISVDRQTDCSSYEEDLSRRRNLFEAAREPNGNFKNDTQVSCRAKCIFNRDGECVANGITVAGNKDSGATCLTFVGS
jgi:hypothetical protein